MEDYTDKRVKPEFSLKDACPDLVEQLTLHFKKMGEDALIDQLQRTMVASRRIAPTPESFYFLAFPVPQSTTQERMKMRLVPERQLEVGISSATVIVDIDDFGEISRFRIGNWPALHEVLAKKVSQLP